MPARHKSVSTHVSLTESFVGRLKPSEATCVVDHYDLKIPNFSLRMLPPSRQHRDGLLSWRYTPRYQDRQLALLLGHYPATGVDPARALALEGWRLATLKLDPRAVLRSVLAEAVAETPEPAPTDLIADMWKLYEPTLDRLSNRHRLMVVSDFTRFVLPVLGQRSIHDLTKRELSDLHRSLTANNGPRAADHYATSLSAFFSYLVKQGIIQISPAQGLPRNGDRLRERFLSLREVALVWRAADRLNPAARGFIRLMILTGARRDEAAGIVRDEVEGDLWSLPARRNKSRRDHLIPLSPMARSVLEACSRFSNSPYFFSLTGRHPIGNFANIKTALDAAIIALQEPGQTGLARWTFHDLRRSLRTGLSALRFDTNISERVLNHQVDRLERRYNRHAFLDEKREALEAWAAALQTELAATERYICPEVRAAAE